ncbi:VWA domain-containing protein [Thioalkalivibrio sp. HK1]|uniref:VWA domain-containing protein n=1 Tax=Thioalkalivibrio sp. HK1 TaxID=1469245 RepID=UPI0004B7B0F7|nr:VWA domain-containing protein [Thioalkalivibrio sp. HK1]
MANQRTDHLPLSSKGSKEISTSDEVDRFLARAARTPLSTERQGRGRLLFAMDATASRERTWDRACHIQGEMFTVTDAIGGLSVQLCHYRGFHEFEAGPWLSNAKDLLARMSAVRCAAGATQIERVLRHAASQAEKARIDAMVFVGDCVEEDVDRLCAAAGVLRLHSIPVFIFHEGYDPSAERAFGEIARLTGGACCRFDASSAAELRDLLRAVATYAAGGRLALKALGKREGGAIRLLEHSLPPPTRTGR